MHNYLFNNMASFKALPSLILLILTIAAVVEAAADAPSPAPPAPLNVTSILKKAARYNTFTRLLKDTEVASQVSSLLQNDRNADGLTVLAPTDAAFAGLRSGTLNRMDAQEQSELVLFHILPRYHTFVTFETTTNPVRTQASGPHGVCTVDVATGGDRQVNVSSGVTEATLGATLYSEFPLAVYSVDRVLLPPDLFGPDAKMHGGAADAPAAAAATGKHGKRTTSSSSGAAAPDEAPEADATAAASAEKVVGWPAFAVTMTAAAMIMTLLLP